MRKVYLLLVFALAWALVNLPNPARADVIFDLGGYYHYSRLEYAAPSTSFSLLSDNGSGYSAEAGVGLKSFDFFVSGKYDQYSFKAPSTRIVSGLDLSTLSYGVGLRGHIEGFWVYLKGDFDEALTVIPDGANFAMGKSQTQLMKAGFKAFGWGAGYVLTIEAEGGYPISTSTASNGSKLSYGYTTMGQARIEFGGKTRVGLYSGFSTEQYSVDTAKHFRLDFTGGICITIQGIGGRRGGSGSSTPRFPLY